MNAPKPPSRRPWQYPNVLALGLTSLATDASSEMIVPFLPIFLTVTLGASATALGLVEGVAEAVASLLKLVSGRLADRTGRRRALVLVGYGLSGLARPLVALASAPVHVLAVRALDRTGKGLRTSPRDAILAASVPAADRGAVYGFHRALDHAGAVVGPILALSVLAIWPDDLRRVFLVAAIPGLVALATVTFGVRDADVAPAASSSAPSISALPSPALRRYLVPLGIFTLGNSSDAFLLLRAGGKGDPWELPILWMAFNLVQAASAGPLGALSDRIGRRRTITAGWLVYAAVYTGFALVEAREGLVALFLVYGLFRSFTEGAEKALVSEVSPGEARGVGFGWYHLVSGLLALPASLLFGWLWDVAGPAAAFGTGAALALVAVAVLAVAGPGQSAGAATQVSTSQRAT